MGRVWHSMPSSTTKIRKAQLESSLSALDEVVIAGQAGLDIKWGL